MKQDAIKFINDLKEDWKENGKENLEALLGWGSLFGGLYLWYILLYAFA